MKSNNVTALQFALYLGLLTLLSRGIPKLLNTILSTKNTLDKNGLDMVFLLAGAIAGFSSILWNSTDITLILAVRSVEAIVNHALYLKLLPKIPYFVELLYAFVVSVLMYAIPFERYAVRKGYVSFLEMATDQRLAHFAELSPILGKECGIPTEVPSSLRF